MIKVILRSMLQLIVICVTITLLVLLIPKQEGRVIDCSMSEFHPDYPPKVKEECRKLNAKKIIYTRRTGEDRNG